MKPVFPRLFSAARFCRRSRQSGDVLLLALILSVLLCGFHALPVAPVSAAEAVTPYPHELAQVSFAAAGDVIPHEAVRQAAAAAGPGQQGWAALFSGVADLFARADFGFVNHETPVAPEHNHGTRAFLFNAPIDLPLALHSIGVKVVSFANNHAMDQGWAGFAETIPHLRQAGLVVVGASDNAANAFQPVFTEAHGIRVGWLGMTRWLNGGRNPDDPALPHVNFLPYAGEPGSETGATEQQAIEAVRAARAQCDFLVISIHWGVEYAPAPRPEDVELAHAMLEAGASVIVGHHPHVLQPVETYRTHADGRDTVIFYSLGNFLSNQSRTYVDGLMPDSTGEPRDALIALFSAVKKDYGPAGTRVELGHVGILPVWGENNRNQLASGRASAAEIRPVLIDREIPRLQARLDALTRPAASPEPSSAPQPKKELTAGEKKEFVELTSRLKLLTDRRAQILARTGDEYLTAPPKLR